MSSGTILKSARGFTIIETIVAIALVGIILASVVDLTTQAIATTNLSKSRTEADNYAQQASDAVRTLRDSIGWSAFYTCVAKHQNWYLTNTLILTTAPPGTPGSLGTSCPVNKPDSAADITPYSRQIILEKDTTVANRVFMDVKVTWSNMGQSQNIDLQSYLTNWQ